MIASTGTEKRLVEALREVEDPELVVNIVDLGLLVDLRLDRGCVHLDLTFTAMGCPAMDMIMDDARARLLREPEVDDVEINVVWSPIWTKERVSDEGKTVLREYGISI